MPFTYDPITQVLFCAAGPALQALVLRNNRPVSIRQYYGHGCEISGVIVLQRYRIASASNIVICHDLFTGVIRWETEWHGSRVVRMREVGSELVCLREDGSIFGVDSSTGDLVFVTEPRLGAVDIQADPHGGILYSNIENRLQSYNVVAGEMEWETSYLLGKVLCFEYSPVLKMLFSGHDTGFVFCHDVDGPRKLLETAVFSASSVTAVHCVEYERYLVVGGSCGTLRCITVDDAQVKWQAETHDLPVTSITDCVDVNRVFSMGLDGRIVCYGLHTGKVKWCIAAHELDVSFFQAVVPSSIIASWALGYSRQADAVEDDSAEMQSAPTLLQNGRAPLAVPREAKGTELNDEKFLELLKKGKGVPRAPGLADALGAEVDEELEEDDEDLEKEVQKEFDDTGQDLKEAIAEILRAAQEGRLDDASDEEEQREKEEELKKLEESENDIVETTLLRATVITQSQNDGILLVRNVITGALLWSYEPTFHHNDAVVATCEHGRANGPDFVNEVRSFAVAFEDGAVRVTSALNGCALWEADGIEGPPVLLQTIEEGSQGLLVHVTALSITVRDELTGALCWRLCGFKGSIVRSAVIVAGKSSDRKFEGGHGVLTWTDDNVLWGWRATTGRNVWVIPKIDASSGVFWNLRSQVIVCCGVTTITGVEVLTGQRLYTVSVTDEDVPIANAALCWSYSPKSSKGAAKLQAEDERDSDDEDEDSHAASKRTKRDAVAPVAIEVWNESKESVPKIARKDRGLLVFALDDGTIGALVLTTGRKLWRTLSAADDNGGRYDPTPSEIVVYEGRGLIGAASEPRVIVASGDEVVVSLKAHTGAVDWARMYEQCGRIHSLQLVKTTLYFASAYKVHLIDAIRGISLDTIRPYTGELVHMKVMNQPAIQVMRPRNGLMFRGSDAVTCIAIDKSGGIEAISLRSRRRWHGSDERIQLHPPRNLGLMIGDDPSNPRAPTDLNPGVLPGSGAFRPGGKDRWHNFRTIQIQNTWWTRTQSVRSFFFALVLVFAELFQLSYFALEPFLPTVFQPAVAVAPYFGALNLLQTTQSLSSAFSVAFAAVLLLIVCASFQHSVKSSLHHHPNSSFLHVLLFCLRLCAAVTHKLLFMPVMRVFLAPMFCSVESRSVIAEIWLDEENYPNSYTPPPDPLPSLVVDRTYQCYTPEHFGFIIAGWIGIVFFVPLVLRLVRVHGELTRLRKFFAAFGIGVGDDTFVHRAHNLSIVSSKAFIVLFAVKIAMVCISLLHAVDVARQTFYLIPMGVQAAVTVFVPPFHGQRISQWYSAATLMLVYLQVCALMSASWPMPLASSEQEAREGVLTFFAVAGLPSALLGTFILLELTSRAAATRIRSPTVEYGSEGSRNLLVLGVPTSVKQLEDIATKEFEATDVDEVVPVTVRDELIQEDDIVPIKMPSEDNEHSDGNSATANENSTEANDLTSKQASGSEQV